MIHAVFISYHTTLYAIIYIEIIIIHRIVVGFPNPKWERGTEDLNLGGLRFSAFDQISITIVYLDIQHRAWEGIKR